MKHKIEAYIADWSFREDIPQEQIKMLTHINYAFGKIVDGQVSVAHLTQLERLQRHRQMHPELLVNLSIGGWTADGFSQAVATEAGRERLAESAVKLIEELDFTGLDWDWEYPTSDEAGIAAAPEDDVNATSLLTLTRQKLDALSAKTGKQYEQSIAVGASRTGDYIWDKAVPVLDSVNLMTYDMHMHGHAAHQTNLYPSEKAAYSALDSVRAFEAAGIPREKLLIGAAFYFHEYNGIQGEGDGLTQPYIKRGKGGGYKEWIARLPEFTRIWDERAHAASYRNGDMVLSGDDSESLRDKGQFVAAEALAGIIIWELTHDYEGELLSALYNGAEE